MISPTRLQWSCHQRRCGLELRPGRSRAASSPSRPRRRRSTAAPRPRPGTNRPARAEADLRRARVDDRRCDVPPAGGDRRQRAERLAATPASCVWGVVDPRLGQPRDPAVGAGLRVAPGLEVDLGRLRRGRIGAGDVDHERVLVGADVRGGGHPATGLAIDGVVEVDRRPVVGGGGHPLQARDHDLPRGTACRVGVGAVHCAVNPSAAQTATPIRPLPSGIDCVARAGGRSSTTLSAARGSRCRHRSRAGSTRWSERRPVPPPPVRSALPLRAHASSIPLP